MEVSAPSIVNEPEEVDHGRQSYALLGTCVEEPEVWGHWPSGEQRHLGNLAYGKAQRAVSRLVPGDGEDTLDVRPPRHTCFGSPTGDLTYYRKGESWPTQRNPHLRWSAEAQLQASG